MQAWQIPFWGSPPTPNRTAADATGANGCPQHPTLPRPAKAKPHGPNIGSGTEPVSGNATRRRKISPPFSSLKKTSQSFSNKQSNAPISKGDRGIFVRHRNLVLPESQAASLGPLAQSENLFCHRIAVVEAQVGRASITRIDREREQRLIQVLSLSQEADAHTAIDDIFCVAAYTVAEL